MKKETLIIVILISALAIILIVTACLLWNAACRDAKLDARTKYWLRVGSAQYRIEEIIEHSQDHLKAVQVGGSEIEVHGQYTLIGD